MAWPAVLTYTPPPSPGGQPAQPSPSFLSQHALHLRLPFGGRSGWRQGQWGARDPKPPASFLPARGGERGRCGELAGGVLTSPPQRPRCRCRGPSPAGGGGPCGHALEASPRCPSGGSARAAAGAVRSAAPLPAPRPGRRRAPAPGPGSPPAASCPCELAPRHGRLRCVAGRRPLAPAAPRRAPSPSRAPRPRRPEREPALGSASSRRYLRSFSSFPSSWRGLPTPTSPHSPLQPATRFSSAPA